MERIKWLAEGKKRINSLCNTEWIVRVIIVAIMMTEVLSACGVRPEAREDRAENVLKRKYGEEFVITRVYPQKFGALYYEVQAYPLARPELLFRAVIDTEDDASADDYVEHIVCAAISELVGENLDKLPAYFYVYTHGKGPQSIVDNPRISIQEYAELDGGNSFWVELYILLERDDPAGLYTEISGMLKGLEYVHADVRLVLVNEEQMNEVQSYFERNEGIFSEYREVTDGCRTIEIPFERGRIAMSAERFAEEMRGA